MVLMLEASEKFTLKEEKTWRNYNRITEGSGANSSNQKSPKKEESPKERDSDEEKYPTIDKGKRRSLYFSCPGNNCSRYQNDVRSSSTSLIVKGLKCVKCDKKMRYGENLKEHCEECHEGRKKEKEENKLNEDEDLWEGRNEEMRTNNKYGTVDEWLKNTSAYEQLRKKLENLGKSGNQDENVIKGQEISSPQQYSENSEKSEKQN